ncbi:unnamed protein product [Meloidogyne enterolobii]|uniref:Uncharacterized protein n=1 Tax=Meloidogyne enterolobii TaxID=390850 RepID=A0ACB1B3W8_MELEN
MLLKNFRPLNAAVASLPHFLASLIFNNSSTSYFTHFSPFAVDVQCHPLQFYHPPCTSPLSSVSSWMRMQNMAQLHHHHKCHCDHFQTHLPND